MNVNGMLPPSVPMPETQAEWYYYLVFAVLASVLVILLLGVVIFFLRRMVNSMDGVKQLAVKMDKDQAVEKQKLSDHISNDGVHCKQGDCPRRRATDIPIGGSA